MINCLVNTPEASMLGYFHYNLGISRCWMLSTQVGGFKMVCLMLVWYPRSSFPAVRVNKHQS